MMGQPTDARMEGILIKLNPVKVMVASKATINIKSPKRWSRLESYWLKLKHVSAKYPSGISAT
jgi:hypothetical protein